MPPGPGKLRAGRKGLATTLSGKGSQNKPTLSQRIKQLEAGTFNPTSLTPTSFDRVPFSSDKQKAARLEAALATQNPSYLNANLDVQDLAAPHRLPYAFLKDVLFHGSDQQISSLVQKLTDASAHCEKAFNNVQNDPKKSDYWELARLYKATNQELQTAHIEYTLSTGLKEKAIRRLELIRALNNLASNAPGLGPHSKTNHPVNNRIHLHVTLVSNEPLTPRGAAALTLQGLFNQKPHQHEFQRTPFATAQDAGVSKVVSTDGSLHYVPSLQSRQPQPNSEDVPAQPNLFRGCLFVDQNGKVFRPKLPAPTLAPQNSMGWELVD